MRAAPHITALCPAGLTLLAPGFVLGHESAPTDYRLALRSCSPRSTSPRRSKAPQIANCALAGRSWRWVAISDRTAPIDFLESHARVRLAKRHARSRGAFPRSKSSKLNGAIHVQIPPGLRKSGIPDSVLIPAPLNATVRRAC